MKKTAILFLIISAAFLIVSCDVESQKVEDADKDLVLAGYHIMAGEEAPIAESGDDARATAPNYNTYGSMTYAELIALGVDGLKINNYPEQGQKTYITVTVEDAANEVYFISSRTEFPNRDKTLDYYLEEYYIQDVAGTGYGIWEWDSIVAKQADGTWDLDPYARKTMELVFQDGSVRKEWVADIWGSWAGAPQGDSYAHFDIDGSLLIPEDVNWTPEAPAAGNDINYSSKVYYYQKTSSPVFWFYQSDKEVFGVRYYTESADPDGDFKTLKTSLAFEHIISQTVPLSSLSDSRWGTFLDWIFNRSNSGEGDATISETVIRYQITENNKKTIKSSTVVDDFFGTKEITIDNEMEYTF